MTPNYPRAFGVLEQAVNDYLAGNVDRAFLEWGLNTARQLVGSAPSGDSTTPADYTASATDTSGLKYDRPDQCPDAAKHAPPRQSNDYRRYRYQKCPSCGFYALLAPATDPKAEQAELAERFAAKAASRLADTSCETPAPAVTP